MFAFLLPLLQPLLTKVSVGTLKWIAGITAVVLTVALLFGGGFVMGHRWEAKAFADYKAKATSHEMELQQKYDAIGGDDAAEYLRAVENSQAETQRQLDELRYAPPIPTPPAVKAVRGHHAKPSTPVAGDPDTERTVRVLRNAFGGQGK